mmetsp:Transcript_18689/g.39157  ORF Transcript_18689/g.39157 Transcript_18689/m.39157 type:complete len:361 (-) Transcript_18689:141-1223(-)
MAVSIAKSLSGHQTTLGPQRPCLQFRQSDPRRQSLVQRPIHRIAYRHLHPQPPRQHPDALRSGHPLRHGIRPPLYLVQRHPSRHLAPHCKIATQTGGAREHEVSHPGESRHGASVGSRRHGEARELGQSAAHQGGAGVVAESQSVEGAGGDGEDVLDGAGDLDADDVVGDVGAEGGSVGDVAGDEGGDLSRFGGDDDVGGLAVHDFLGEGRTGEDGEVAVVLAGQFAHHHLVRRLGSAHFESLGARDDGAAHRKLGEVGHEEPAEELSWYDEEHDLNVRSAGILDGRVGLDVAMDLVAGEVGFIFASVDLVAYCGGVGEDADVGASAGHCGGHGHCERTVAHDEGAVRVHVVAGAQGFLI